MKIVCPPPPFLYMRSIFVFTASLYNRCNRNVLFITAIHTLLTRYALAMIAALSHRSLLLPCIFVVFLQLHRYPAALRSLCYRANRYVIDNLSQPSTIWSLETLIGSIYNDHAAIYNSQRSLFCRYTKKP